MPFGKIAQTWPSNKAKILRKIAVTSKLFFIDNWQKQGFMGNTLYKWKPRKSGGERPILVLTGRLKASLKTTRVTGDQIKVVTNVFYAGLHNYGGVNSSGRNVPQRKFMGKSSVLNGVIENEIRGMLKMFIR